MVLLLDQNVPLAVAGWLRAQQSEWNISHVNELDFQGRPDEFLYRWAQEHRAIVITYDEHLRKA